MGLGMTGLRGMKGLRAPLLLVAGMALAVAGCGERELILPGKRLDIRAPLDAAGAAGAAGQEAAEGSAQTAGNRALPISLPAQINHQSWPQRLGNAAHHLQHPALGTTLAPFWSASIGAGNSRKFRITADPVVAGGRIFTLDSRAGVMAHSLAGKALWKTDITPPGERAGQASGGGLALSGDVLFVTSGYGELVALDTATGALRWRQKLDAAATGAPAVKEGIVYVVSRDNRALAIDAKNGRILWELPGVPAQAVMITAAAPAVGEKFVIFPFGTGELTAAFRKGGIRIWRTPVAGKRKGRAYAITRDLTSDPVIAGDIVYAANASGRAVALDLASGERIWSANEGAYGPMWPAGGSVFLISDDSRLLRLDAGTGEKIWEVALPYFVREKPKKRKAIHAHYGPVLAGGRLIVASSDGLIRAFDPVDGGLLSTIDLPGGAASAPVIVNRTLYVVTRKGQLRAYR